MIETASYLSDPLEQIASRWYQLNHPNVVKLFGACHTGSPPFLVYETIPQGRQLHQVLVDRMNRRSTMKIVYKAALGLQYLHSRKVVHGNLRVESIIVSPDSRAKLGDIGGSQYPRSVGERHALNWMVPELTRGEPPASFASDIYAFGMCIWEALTLELPWKDHDYWQTKRKREDGEFPDRPDSMRDGEWDLIAKMCVSEPSTRVSTTYVVNRVKQLVTENGRVRGSQESSFSSKTQYNPVDEQVFAELDGATISNAIQQIRSRYERLEGFKWMASNVYPVLEYIFALIRERNKTPVDVEVWQFCGSLCRFKRYVCTAVSEKSVYQLARSRQVVETRYVIYAELDRLLDMLDASKTDPIRVWRRDDEMLFERQTVPPDLECTGSKSEPKKNLNAISSAIKLNHFDTPSSNHDVWTRAGLAALRTAPPWFISLQDLMFSGLDQIGQGAFGTVYKGTWLDTPVVIEFMGYEEDFDTISTDPLLHEVRVWDRLNHPHLLKLYGVCHIDKRYFVCEYASNGDLAKYLSKPSNEHWIWQKLYEAALGLQYLHELNIGHNGLKCDNTMVSTDGKAKLIDFGLSCLLNEAEIQVEVKKMGTVHWKSPEYLAGERPSFASDVYSFVMRIMEAVSGDAPWGKSMLPAMIRYRVKKGDISPMPESMNEKQRNLVRLMARFDPSERVKIAFVVDKLNEIAQDEKNKKAP